MQRPRERAAATTPGVLPGPVERERLRQMLAEEGAAERAGV